MEIQWPNVDTQWRLFGQIFASLITLVAVLVATMLNFKADRIKQRQTLKPALLYEISWIVSLVEAALKKGTDPIRLEGLEFERSMFPIFESNATSITLLKPDICNKVFEFYQSCLAVPAVIRTVNKVPQSDISKHHAEKISALGKELMNLLGRK